MADHNPVDWSSVLSAPPDASHEPESAEDGVQSINDDTEGPAPTCPTWDEQENANPFGDRIVHLFIGPERVKYTIHEHVLSSAGKESFFSALFNSGFQESMTGQAEMPEDDPRLLGYLFKWLYAAHIGVKKFGYLFNSLPLQRLFQLYNVGQKFLLEDFQDAIITTVYSKLRCDHPVLLALALDPDAFNDFQDNILPDSHMYKLVSRAMAVSMLQPAAKMCVHKCFDYEHDSCPSREDSTTMPDEVLAVISDEFMRQIFSDLLKMVDSGACTGFSQAVGPLDSFKLKKLPSQLGSDLAGWGIGASVLVGWGNEDNTQ